MCESIDYSHSNNSKIVPRSHTMIVAFGVPVVSLLVLHEREDERVCSCLRRIDLDEEEFRSASNRRHVNNRVGANLLFEETEFFAPVPIEFFSLSFQARD